MPDDYNVFPQGGKVDLSAPWYIGRPWNNGQPVQYRPPVTSIPSNPSDPVVVRFAPGHSEEEKKTVQEMLGQLHKTPAQKADETIRALDIRVGDRVRMTWKTAPDASTIEGNVVGVKDRNGIQLRIAGFDHTGGRRYEKGVTRTGGQHVWFHTGDYSVEVLHRAYRWTPEDQIIAEVAGVKPSEWEGMTDFQRERRRLVYGNRAKRIKELLGVDADA